MGDWYAVEKYHLDKQEHIISSLDYIMTTMQRAQWLMTIYPKGKGLCYIMWTIDCNTKTRGFSNIKELDHVQNRPYCCSIMIDSSIEIFSGSLVDYTSLYVKGYSF